MRIAIIGSGISGLTSAYLLSKQHEVVVYEANDYIGGHTATIDIEYQGKPYSIDTGFIVFNDRTYPLFQKLLHQLGVEYQPASMGFSVSCERTGLEYSGENLNTLFAQRRNLLNVRHWRMIKDILRFNRESIVDVEQGGMYQTMLLGDYLEHKNYSQAFIDNYLIPMGAAIWSASTRVMKKFPLPFFVKFFANHGLLSVNDRPQWYVIKGGSRSYIKPLIKKFSENIYLHTPIQSIRRDVESKTVTINTGQAEEVFDHVVLACHSDQALRLLSDVSAQEKSVLGNIQYQMNDVVLHADESLLPQNKMTWSSWNYRLLNDSEDSELPPVLTYNMNILQSLSAPCTFSVTLNHTQAIQPETILGQFKYAHPVFTQEAVSAQQQWSAINGVMNTWFCGAYWANGFHEDGVKSAVRVAQAFGIEL